MNWIKLYRKYKGGIWIKTEHKSWIDIETYRFYKFNNFDPIEIRRENYTKIGLLKKRLKDKLWVIKIFKQYLNEAERLDTFKTFKCNDFFVGKETAEFNQQSYYRQIKRVRRKLDFIAKFM